MKTVDYQKVKQITGILSGKAVDIQSEPGTETHVEPVPPRWLYSFRSKFLYIENIQLNSLAEIKTVSEASALLEKYTTELEMKTFAVFMSGEVQTLPAILENHTGVRIITIADSQALGNAIFMETGVRVDPAKLDKVDFRTLARRAIDFVSGIKKRDEIVSRLQKNMRKNLR
jgi:hypothetical protein